MYNDINVCIYVINLYKVCKLSSLFLAVLCACLSVAKQRVREAVISDILEKTFKA